MTRKTYAQPVLVPQVFSSIQEIDVGISKLKRRIDEVSQLAKTEVSFDDQRIKNAESNIAETIGEVFGRSSPEFDKHQYYDIWSGPIVMNMLPVERQACFEKGLPKTTMMLEGLISRLEEKKHDFEVTVQSAPILPNTNGNDVFIVHGRHNESRETVARFISQLGLNPIILHERSSQGKTVIEKLEANTNVGFAVVLLTADDVGGLKDGNPTEYKPRARQNVVFELGYFFGKLGRNRVCAILEKGVELQSDIEGLVYVPWDSSGSWKMILFRELKAAGYDVDANKVF